MFAVLLYLAWIGAWMLEQTLEARCAWMTTSGGRFAYWLAMKLLLWIMPSLLIIRRSGQTFKEAMGFDRRRGILLWGGGLGCFLAATTLIAKTLLRQPIFSSPVGWPLFSAVLVSPAVEEITFRGAILGALENRFRFAAANTITALLFLGAHMPGWYFQGRLLANLKTPAGGALSIFLLGWLFGYAAHKSRSAAASTLCHALNNLFNA